MRYKRIHYVSRTYGPPSDPRLVERRSAFLLVGRQTLAHGGGVGAGLSRVTQEAAVPMGQPSLAQGRAQVSYNYRHLLLTDNHSLC